MQVAKSIHWSTDDLVVGVNITFPDPMSVDELDELQEFLDLWMRGMRRRASPPIPKVDLEQVREALW
jgi:hypothetical protein